LLFRAYGRSPKAWPVQAGLAGNDSLILLDEAHCSQPFMETLHAVRKYRSWAEAPLPNPFHVSIMSATPPDTADVFGDTSEEPVTKGHPLGDRQLAPKKARLRPSSASGEKARIKLAKDLVKEAETLVGGKPLAAVIFANYVATAREVHHQLAQKYGENAILLTGRMRPIDKDDTVSERLKRFQLSSDQAKNRCLGSPVFVVATQTLEVGADLDFDVLVTECASLDALRQRFGRLNRMGRAIEARAAILMRADLVKSSAEDPVYGEPLGQTWQWLIEQAGETGEIDMGISALNQRLNKKVLQKLNATAVHAPVMLPAHLDCWGQTMPAPVPTPDVAIFLHGPGRASADVQVCWRADIDLSTPERAEKSLDVMALCPPSVAEALAVPVWAMRHWMQAGETPMDKLSDVEGSVFEDYESKTDGAGMGRVRSVIRWRGREEAEVVSDSAQVKPGDVVVIPATEKGWESLGDFPFTGDSKPPQDWGDRAYTKVRGKCLLRLHPAVIEQWPDGEPKTRFQQLADQARIAIEEDPEGFSATMKDALAMLSGDETAPAWLKKIASGLASEPMLKRDVILHPLEPGVILRGRERIDLQAEQPAHEDVDWFSDEDDASSSGTTYVLLENHLKAVGGLTRRFATGCGLPDDLVDAESTAGMLHDPGKADPRFQALLRGGNPWARGELLAKSEEIPQGRLAYARARKAAGYPEGYRHELLSVRLAESAIEALPADAQLLELALHLIASHHGHCRPFAPVVFDENPVDVTISINGLRLSANSNTRLERLDSGVSERFWKLTRRYGWWGLAWLETILRLADHRQSEHEEQERRVKR
jgi:CRISPR-associated endonuclease/helicase Cas3